MGLTTDKIFFEALKADTAFMAAIGNRLYETAVPVPDDQLDNVPLPYCIVTFDGLNNTDTTKDDPYESDFDQVQIGISLVAKTREELGTLAKQVRSRLHDEFEWCHRYDELRDSTDASLETSDEFRLMVLRDYETVINEIPVYYNFSAEAVQMDPWKPCRWQVLHYQCEVKRPEDNDEQEE